MEVDHTYEIMRCVRGGMVGCGTQPLLENADSTAPSIPIGDNPAPVVPLFDLIRLLVGAPPKNFGPLNKHSVQLRATILNIDSVLPLLSALPSYTGLGKRVVPRLRESRPLTTCGCGWRVHAT